MTSPISLTQLCHMFSPPWVFPQPHPPAEMSRPSWADFYDANGIIGRPYTRPFFAEIFISPATHTLTDLSLVGYPWPGGSALYSLFSELTFSEKLSLRNSRSVFPSTPVPANNLTGPKTTTNRLEVFRCPILLRRDEATLLSGRFASAPKKSSPFIYFPNL